MEGRGLKLLKKRHMIFNVSFWAFLIEGYFYGNFSSKKIKQFNFNKIQLVEDESLKPGYKTEKISVNLEKEKVRGCL